MIIMNEALCMLLNFMGKVPFKHYFIALGISFIFLDTLYIYFDKRREAFKKISASVATDMLEVIPEPEDIVTLSPFQFTNLLCHDMSKVNSADHVAMIDQGSYFDLQQLLDILFNMNVHNNFSYGATERGHGTSIFKFFELHEEQINILLENHNRIIFANGFCDQKLIINGKNNTMRDIIIFISDDLLEHLSGREIKYDIPFLRYN